MKLRFFGRLRDAIGDELEVELPREVANSEQLRAWLGCDHPVVLNPGVKIVLDDRILIAPTPLAGVCEVAFLPPVSGG